MLIGRSHLGVHWRMDGVNGALVGETSTVRRLQQVRLTQFELNAPFFGNLLLEGRSGVRETT